MLPALIDDDSRPRFLSSDDKEFSEIAAQLDLVSKSEGLEVSWLSRGNELVLAV
jgi:hypothetical protein